MPISRQSRRGVSEGKDLTYFLLSFHRVLEQTRSDTASNLCLEGHGQDTDYSEEFRGFPRPSFHTPFNSSFIRHSSLRRYSLAIDSVT